MFDPTLFILIPPAMTFGWVAYDLRRRAALARKDA